MTRARLPMGLALVAVLATGCWAADEKPPPSITAQGFELAQPREATVGTFSNVRLRFEVPVGIESLVVRERSFEIDLAKSPEAARLQLFGIERRVWSKRDVTLDLSSYLNEKIERPGEYELIVEVADRDARTTSAKLQIVVTEPRDEETPDPSAEEPVSTDPDAERPPAGETADEPDDTARLGEELPFRLQRVGAGSVEGGEQFGITWKTVDEVAVVIRMMTLDDRAGRFARLDPIVYDALATRDDLHLALDRLELADTLEIPTANGAASGAVVAVVRPDERYVLRTEHSSTSLSERGTTVTLSGRYRELVKRH